MQAINQTGSNVGPHLETLLNFLGLMQEDFPKALELLASDVTWTNLLPAHVPFGGRFHGHDGVAEYFQRLAADFELGSYDFDSFDCIGTSDCLVVVGVESGGKALPTGKIFDLPFVWVIKFNEEGLIHFFQEHNDTQAIGDAFRA